MKDKRNIRNYKIPDKPYFDAMKASIDTGGALAVHVEFFVKCIADGAKITVKTKEGKRFTIGPVK